MVTDANSLVLECSPQMHTLLTALTASGLFGPNVESCAQRLLELKLYELSLYFLQATRQNPNAI